MARPKIEIDWKQFEGYCAMQCTLREIADYFNCSEDTIERRVRDHYNGGFAETFKRKRQVGLMSLRRSMFNLAAKHPNMAIFLAKNWLGMKDVQEIKGNVSINDKDKRELSDEELQKVVLSRRADSSGSGRGAATSKDVQEKPPSVL